MFPLAKSHKLSTPGHPRTARGGLAAGVWAAGEGEEDGGGTGGATDQPAVGSFTVVPSSRAPVIPYFFGFHSRASFWASNSWTGIILMATLSRFLTAMSRPSPGGNLEAASLNHI